MSLIARMKERQRLGIPVDRTAAAAARAARAAAAAVHDDTGASPDAPPAKRAWPTITPAARKRLAGEAAAAFAGLVGRSETGLPIEGESPAALFIARQRLQLDEHRRELKAIQSVERKIELKRQILPLYDDWIAQALAAGAADRGPHDEITIAVMIWRMDVGDFIGALPIADYALRFGLPMPGHFKSTLPVFITEAVADAAIKAYRPGGDDAVAAAFPAGVLAAVEDLVEDEDMHDQVRAKLQKAIGLAVMAGATDDDRVARQQETLRRYLRALELDQAAGVKKDIEQLQRQLKKAEAEAPPAEPAIPHASDESTNDPDVGPTDPAAVEAVLEPDAPGAQAGRSPVAPNDLPPNTPLESG